MSGWNIITQIRSIEQRADLLGMRLAPYKHDDRYGDNVALIPKDKDALPIYTRDAVLFAGSLEGAGHWMQGVLWAREYDRMAVDKNMNEKRERKEQDERNKQIVRILKEEKLSLVPND